MTPIRTRLLCAGAIIAAATGPAGATDYQASGTVTFITVDSDSVKLPGNAVRQRVRLKGVVQADDPASPIHLSAQDCGGSVVVDAEGAVVNGGGYCETIDKDGDLWWLSWRDYDGTANKWTITGGTGKYQGMTGTGSVTVMMQSADGRTVNRWQGSWTMK